MRKILSHLSGVAKYTYWRYKENMVILKKISKLSNTFGNIHIKHAKNGFLNIAGTCVHYIIYRVLFSRAMHIKPNMIWTGTLPRIIYQKRIRHSFCCRRVHISGSNMFELGKYNISQFYPSNMLVCMYTIHLVSERNTFHIVLHYCLSIIYIYIYVKCVYAYLIRLLLKAPIYLKRYYIWGEIRFSGFTKRIFEHAKCNLFDLNRIYT